METPYGRIHCTMKGVPKTDRPIILTMHDIGLNRKLVFVLFSFLFSSLLSFGVRLQTTTSPALPPQTKPVGTRSSATRTCPKSCSTLPFVTWTPRVNTRERTPFPPGEPDTHVHTPI